MPESLRNKTLKGVGWSAVDNMAQYAVSFVVSIILARLLSPDDYGLLGIIAVFTAVCNALIDGGFPDALIRKKEVSSDDYNTAFLVNLSASVLLYTIVFLSAPFIARYFGRNELVSLTRVSSLGIIIGSFSIVQQTRLTKRLDFKSQTKITIISSSLSGLIGIVMAISGFGVWALVAQGLSKLLFRMALLSLYNHWIPKLRFSNASFKSLFGFGWKISVSHLLNTVWDQLYQVVIGKFYNPATLGQYTRATQFSSLFSSNLTNVVQRVSFPVLSEIQDDRTQLVSAYKRIIKTTMFVTAIASLSLGAISEPLLFCLIGPKWYDAATYLPLICISASLYPLHAINLNMLKIQGRSDLFLTLEIIKKIIAIGPVLIGIFIGIRPMLVSGILVSIASYFLNSWYSGKAIGYDTWMQIKDIIPFYCIAFVIATPVWALKYLPLSQWIVLPVQICLIVLLFIFICNITKVKEYHDVIDMVKPLIIRITKNCV